MFLACGLTFAQAPNQFNYQAIARDASGGVLANQSVSVQISILVGSTTGTAVYSETHSATTTAHGLFNFKIGSGTVGSGSISTIDWSANSYFIKIEFDPQGGTSYTELSTTQLVSVPYALFANEVMNDNVDDADADPANELQTLSLSNDTLEISAGNYVDLSPYAVSTLALNGTDLELTEGSNVSTVDLSALVDDADADPTNELQTLSISNDTLFLSGGDTVVLPSNAAVVGGSNTEMLFNNNGTEDGSNMVYNSTSNTYAIGTTTVSDYTMLVYRPSTNNGDDKTNVYGYRNGTSGSTNGGSGWDVDAVDVALKGYSYWGNEYSAAIAGYSYFDYGNCAAVLGGDQSGSPWGALGYQTTGYSMYAGYFNGNVAYTGTLSSVSDQRLKTNIEPLQQALEMVEAIEVKTYNYRDDAEFKDMNLAAGKQYGFIAQQLETVVPELVNADFATTQGGDRMGKAGSTAAREDALKTVNYIGMIPILTQAIKEQQALIEQLQHQVEELQNK